jgi:RNA 2',3'-cyclic 3'-phosphodiesterase
MSPTLISNRRPRASDPLFLMLRPDQAAAAAIHRIAWGLRDALGLTGRPLARELLHISLCALGPYGWLTQRIFSEINAVLASLAMPCFRAGFGWCESFRHPTRRPLVLRGDETLTGVEMLHAELMATLCRISFAPSPRRFTPHMTLLRDPCDTGEREIDQISWLVRDIVLICSLRGRGQHMELCRWPLRHSALTAPAP